MWAKWLRSKTDRMATPKGSSTHADDFVGRFVLVDGSDRFSSLSGIAVNREGDSRGREARM